MLPRIKKFPAFLSFGTWTCGEKRMDADEALGRACSKGAAHGSEASERVS